MNHINYINISKPELLLTESDQTPKMRKLKIQTSNQTYSDLVLNCRFNLLLYLEKPKFELLLTESEMSLNSKWILENIIVWIFFNKIRILAKI